MTANPNPGASGSIACPACDSAIEEPCKSQKTPGAPATMHPHTGRVAEYRAIARAAREAELDARRAEDEEYVRKLRRKLQRARETAAAASEWLDRAAAVTPPPNPETADHIRSAIQSIEHVEVTYFTMALKQAGRDIISPDGEA